MQTYSMMISLILFTCFLSIRAASISENACPVKNKDLRTGFNLTAVVGPWYSVAMLLDHNVEDTLKNIACYKVEFSQPDSTAFEWLLNRTLKKGVSMSNYVNKIMRQRYHSTPPFDIWSVPVEGVAGCYRQVLSLNTDKRDIGRQYTDNAEMQLHLIEPVEQGEQPILVQLLYGNIISVIIYKRVLNISNEELKKVSVLVTKLRGKWKVPRTCDPSALSLHGYKHYTI